VAVQSSAKALFVFWCPYAFLLSFAFIFHVFVTLLFISFNRKRCLDFLCSLMFCSAKKLSTMQSAIKQLPHTHTHAACPYTRLGSVPYIPVYHDAKQERSVDIQGLKMHANKINFAMKFFFYKIFLCVAYRNKTICFFLPFMQERRNCIPNM